MRFNDHSRFADSHALLGPSKPSWVNYDEEKLDAMVFTSFAARRGTELHDLAQRLITLGVPLPKTRQTMNQYVNDAIGFRMQPEQTVFYSPNCYGKTDAISFREMKLRIHDLKTGVTKSGMTQLLVYAALFCLEYGFKATEIEMELRIYQNDDVRILIADPLDVTSIMIRIIEFDKRINVLKEEMYG
jgi:hypothetical protein